MCPENMSDKRISSRGNVKCKCHEARTNVLFSKETGRPEEDSLSTSQKEWVVL